MDKNRYRIWSIAAFFVAASASMLLAYSSFLSPVNSLTTTPTTMNFQGRLTTAAGAVVADGLYNMKFALYDAASAGTLKWSEIRETTTRVQITNGLFSTKLGEATPLDASIFASGSLYFQITMATPATANCSTASCASWESPMTSRSLLSTGAYAYNSEALDGLDSSAFGQLSATNVWTGTNMVSATNVAAFKVQSATGTNALTVDTVNGRLTTQDITTSGISLLPWSSLYTNVYWESGTNRSIGGGYGTDSWLDAGTGVYNFATAYATNPGDVITENSVMTIANNGATAFQNAANSTAAFGVYNAAGANMLTIDTTNSVINLEQNTVLGASKSLTITGGNTASRPSSPTEGMLYYDSETKQLLVYTNGWQSDSKTVTFIVAAGNSSRIDRDGAQYVTNGENSTGSGTGTIDGDQIEINGALSAAAAAGGGIVYLAPGTYTIDSSIDVPNNVTLAGSGATTVIQMGNFGATTVNLPMIENVDASTGAGVVVRDLQLDGRKSLNTAGWQTGIYFEHMGGTNRLGGKITNVYAHDLHSSGIEVYNSVGNTITGNNFSYNYGSAVYANGSASNTFSNNTITNNDVGIALVGGSLSNTVSSNAINSNNTYGISIESASHDNIVNSNTLKDNVGTSIYVANSNHATITGNSAVGSGSIGIFLDTSNKATVNNNTVRTSGDDGISLNGANSNVISGNEIQDSCGATYNDGIYLYNSDANTITSNQITDTAYSVSNHAIAIADSGSDKNYLSNNVFSTTVGDAIVNDGGTGTVFASQSRIENGGQLTVKTTDSTAAFQIQKAGGSMMLNADTTNSVLSVVGGATIQDSASPTKAIRYRTSGGALDMDVGGADMYFSTFSDLTYTEADQKIHLVLHDEANIAEAIGQWQFRSGDLGFGTTRHTIDGSTSGNVAFNQDAEATDFTVQGDTDTHLLFVQGSTDRVGIGTDSPSAKLQVAGNTLIKTTDATALQVQDATGTSLLTADTTHKQIDIAVDGNILVRAWGGSGSDYGKSLAKTADGGYVVTGSTTSYGSGAGDMFLAKYSSSGALSWSKTWGGTSGDYGTAVVQTADGGYAVTGETDSYGAGNADMFLAKYDSSGTLSWSKTWGGSDWDWGMSLVQTSDDGFAITGETDTFGAGSGDMFLVKYDSSGTLSWDEVWGGTNWDYGNSVVQTADDGFAITGETDSYGGGSGDMFLAKYSSSGVLTWNKTWGDTGDEVGNSLVQTADGGYAVTGKTNTYGAGNTDMFLAKYGSTGTLTWSKTWGGADWDNGRSVVPTADGGYAVTGDTDSYGAGVSDLLLVKYDSSGNLTWNKTFGGTGNDFGHSVIQTAAGGYVVAGETGSYGVGGSDLLVARYDSSGVISSCSSPMCGSPTATTGSPTATTGSPTATTGSPSATTGAPTATTSSPTFASAIISREGGFNIVGDSRLTGDVHVKSAVDSKRAFEVQNAAGTDVLVADTFNGGVTIGAGSDSMTIGSQLYSGDFSANWTTTGWDVSGVTVATHTTGNTDSLINTGVAIAPGNTYQVSFYLNGTCGTNSDTLSVSIGDNTLVSGLTGHDNCAGTFTYVATAATTTGLTFVPTNDWAGVIQNISIKRLSGAYNPTLTLNNASGVANIEIRTSSAPSNTFIGLSSGMNNASGAYNSTVGAYSLQANTTGSYNTATGYQSLLANVDGGSNTATGADSLRFNTAGGSNTAMGASSLRNNVTGSNNTATGASSLYDNTTGNYNVAMGGSSLHDNATGVSNTAVGYGSSQSNTTGSYNVSLGYYAGYQDSNGTFVSGTALQNATAIGAYAQVQSSNSIVLGSVDTATKVGIGITTPTNTLSVSPVDLNSPSITATQSGTTVTASGSIFSGSQVGELLVWADGTMNNITGYTSATQVTVENSATRATPSYFRTHHVGLQVTDTGDAYVQGDSDNLFSIRDKDGVMLLNVNTQNGYVINNSTASGGGNLLENPGFEAQNDNWSSNGWNDPWYQFWDASARSGYYTMRLTSPDDVTALKRIVVTPGETMYGSVYVRNVSGSGQGGFYVEFTDKNGGNISYCNSDWTNPGSTFALKSQTCVVPAGAMYAHFSVTERSGATGTWYFDDAYFGKNIQVAPQTFRNQADSTAAFAIQNATGTNLLTMDTTNTALNLTSVVNVNGLTPPSAPTIAKSAGGTLAQPITYLYRLAAVNAAGRTNAVNSSPASLATDVTNKTITVSWSAVTGATGYYVYRSIDAGVTWYRNYVAGGGTVSAVDNGSNFTWSGTNFDNDQYTNTTAAINVVNGGQLAFNGGLAQIGTMASTQNVFISNNAAGKGVAVQADFFKFQDTTGYNDNFVISSTGATTFKNRVNSASAFAIQNTAAANVFTVDTQNNRVGIGTSAPANLLTVTQPTAGVGTVQTNGTVNLVGNGTTFQDTFRVGDTLTVSGETVRTISTITDNTHLAVTSTFSTTASGLSYTLSGGNRLTVMGNGNVGIGTANPGYRFHVVGGTSLFYNATFTSTNQPLLDIQGTATPSAGGTQIGFRSQLINAPTGSANTGIGGTISVTDGTAFTNTLQGLNVTVSDTGSTAKTVRGLFVDTTGTTNGSASVTTALFKAVSSTTAFQIQNASATLFNVDTSTTTITIGNSGNTVTYGSTFEPILAGTARHAKTVVLTPEYAGSVLDAASDTGGTVNCSTTNNGTMTSGFNVAARQNYYNWTSGQAGGQCYDVVVQVPIPSDWSAWNGAASMYVYNSVGTDSTSVAVNVIDTAGTNDANYSATSYNGVSSGTTFASTNLTAFNGTYTAGGYMTVKVRMTSASNKNVRIGNITLNYYSKY